MSRSPNDPAARAARAVEQAFQAALTLHRAGHFDRAADAYRQILSAHPDHPRALHSLGVLEKSRGNPRLAIDLISRAIALHPDGAEFHNNLGDAYSILGRLDEAIASFRRAIALQPTYVKALNNLGNALWRSGQFSEGIAALRRAIALQPSYARAYSNLGVALSQSGQQMESIDSFRRAIALEPEYQMAQSNLLMTLHYVEHDPAELAAAHRQWAERFADPITAKSPPHQSDRDPNRPLRIGYVSGDFKSHAVATFFLPVLLAHDRSGFHVTCYSNVSGPDSVTQLIGEKCDAWRDIAGMSDDQAAALVRQDRIDLLIDLAGHSARNRLLLFARQPAPVQVTWLGYPNTTGMRAIDYRATDAVADPVGQTEASHAEQLMRLRSCWIYGAPTDAPAVAPPPVMLGNPPTFGSFNTLAKVTPEMIDLWAALLSRVAGSRILIKAAAAGDNGIRDRIWRQFRSRGIEEDRVLLMGRLAESQRHLESYAQVDVMLDTFPYNGTTMTCEAMWMGVPVVTLAGKDHVSRVGASLLQTVGLDHLIATTTAQYIDRAAALISDLPRLKQLRQELRSRMLASPLLDAAGFTRELESTYRKVWHAWCSKSR